MILDEAILHAEEVADKCALTDGNIQCETDHRQLAEWLKDYKRLLEQEPCEDAISRQAALDAFGLSEKTRKYGGDQSGYDTMMLYEIQQTLEDLPPVNPQPKTGHWIFKEPTGNSTGRFECSECTMSDIHSFGRIVPYCWYCGAKMVEPQESEEQI